MADVLSTDQYLAELRDLGHRCMGERSALWAVGEIERLQAEVDYCVVNHDAELKKYREALEEICRRGRSPIAEKALGLTDDVPGEAATTWVCANCKSVNRDDYHRISCPTCATLRPSPPR